MNKLLVIALTLPVFLVVMGGADCGGTSTCTSDADCDGTTNSAGEETPFCDTDASVCIPAADECEDDLDCQLLDPDSATSTEEHACTTNADCDTGEACIETNTGFHKCAAPSVAGDCSALAGTSAVDVTDVDGATFETCLSDATCEANGACTFE